MKKKQAYADNITQTGISDLHVTAVLPLTCPPLTVDVKDTLHLRFAMQHSQISQKSFQY